MLKSWNCRPLLKRFIFKSISSYKVGFFMEKWNIITVFFVHLFCFVLFLTKVRNWLSELKTWFKDEFGTLEGPGAVWPILADFC